MSGPEESFSCIPRWWLNVDLKPNWKCTLFNFQVLGVTLPAIITRTKIFKFIFNCCGNIHFLFINTLPKMCFHDLNISQLHCCFLCTLAEHMKHQLLVKRFACCFQWATLHLCNFLIQTGEQPGPLCYSSVVFPPLGGCNINLLWLQINK